MTVPWNGHCKMELPFFILGIPQIDCIATGRGSFFFRSSSGSTDVIKGFVHGEETTETARKSQSRLLDPSGTDED